MNRILGWAAFAAMTAAPALAVDPSVLSLAPPDAALLIGADAGRVLASPLGRQALSMMNASEEQMNKVTGMLGFDPRRDMSEVLIALPDAGSRKGALVLARGSFDESRLTGLAGLQGGSMSSHQGFTMLTSPKSKDSMAFVGGVIAAGETESVKSAIDRSKAGDGGVKGLAERIQAASARHDLWLLTTVGPAKFAGMAPKHAPGAAGGQRMDTLLNGALVQGIESVAAGFKFGANVEMSGEAVAGSEKDAQALADVLRFVASMAGGQAPAGTPIATMLGSLQATTDGRTVKFSMSAPQAEFEKLLEMRGGPRRAAAVR